MSAISGEISSIQSLLDTTGLTSQNLKGVEERMGRLAASIHSESRRGALSPADVDSFMALRDSIDMIKPTLIMQEPTESKQREVPRGSSMSCVSGVEKDDYQKFIDRGMLVGDRHNKGTLSRKDAEAYATEVYKRLSTASDAQLSDLSDLVKFVNIICPGFEPPALKDAYVFQGERVMAEGGLNQYSWSQGSKASCASNAVNFIARTFSEDPDRLTGKDVKEIIKSGKTLFDQFVLPEKRKTVQKLAEDAAAAKLIECLANQIGVEQGAAAKTAFVNAYTKGELDPQTQQEYEEQALKLYAAEGEAAKQAVLKEHGEDVVAPIAVIPFYEAHLGECPASPPSVVLPHDNPKAVKDHFRHIIDTALKKEIPLGGKVGTTINFNGATHAMTVERRHDDTYKFYIFDSHGRRELNGTKAGFLYKTDSEKDAIEYLSRMISMGTPYKNSRNNPRGLNEISYVIIKPPLAAHDPVDEKEPWANSSIPPLQSSALRQRRGASEPALPVVAASQQVAASKQQGYSTAVRVLGVASLVLGLLGTYMLPSLLSSE